MCPNDTKKGVFPTCSKHDSDHVGSAPTLGRRCRQSFTVVRTFFKIALFGVIWAYFLKMCPNDLEKDDFAKVGKHVYDVLDNVPTLPTCCRPSFRVIGVLWSTLVFGLETHILVFEKKGGQEKVGAISGTKLKKEAVIGTKFDFRKKKFFLFDFQKCAQTTPKRAIVQIEPKSILVVWALLPHLGDGADKVLRSSEHFSKPPFLESFGHIF